MQAAAAYKFLNQGIIESQSFERLISVNVLNFYVALYLLNTISLYKSYV